VKLNAINIQYSSEQLLKSNNEISENIINNEKMSQIIQNFSRIEVKEMKPLMSLGNNFEIVVNEIIHLLEGVEMVARRHKIINYLSNHNIVSKEIYDWLLNNQDNPNSVFLLGTFNHYGIEVNVNEQKAFELYQDAVNSGEVSGIFGLAYCYEIGIGTGIDKQKAFELYQKVANLGNAYGINSLGYCYLRGIGTSINNQKAFELFQKSANLGNRHGMFNLGYCYNIGVGTGINKQKAFELKQKAMSLNSHWKY
jgi:TPR repeat protein